MVYGVIMETVRVTILRSYGSIMWRRIVHEIDLLQEKFNIYSTYDDALLIQICECKIISTFLVK